MATVLLRKARLTEIPSPPGSPQPSSQRRFASYANETVLIDPKKYGDDPDDAIGDKVYDRAKDLAETLGSLRSDEFLTLKCKGLFEDNEQRQFCFVYGLPSHCEPPSTRTPPSSLLQYVTSSFKPSVTARIKLAHRLALSIRKIHEEGWLHKGIRSENILFFQPRQNAPRSLDNPRLVGFDFARKEGSGEYSEKPMSVNAGCSLKVFYHTSFTPVALNVSLTHLETKGIQMQISTVIQMPFVTQTPHSLGCTIIMV